VSGFHGAGASAAQLRRLYISKYAPAMPDDARLAFGQSLVDTFTAAWDAAHPGHIGSDRIGEMLDEINGSGDDHFETAYAWDEYDGGATAGRYAETDAAYVLTDGTVIKYDEPAHSFVARRHEGI
jgi:hypothetical protein